MTVWAYITQRGILVSQSVALTQGYPRHFLFLHPMALSYLAVAK